MTTYTSISNASVAVGGIPSSATVTALRDNPIAVAESSAGAPVVAAGWHPYDKVTNGDTSTGLLFDIATSGTKSSVETPNFEDGYEYRLVIQGLSGASGSSNLRIEAYGETAGAYDTTVQNTLMTIAISNTTATSAYSFYLDAEILWPRVSSNVHFMRGVGLLYDGAGSYTGANLADNMGGRHFYATAQKLLKVRAVIGTAAQGYANFDAGKVYLFRRREFISKV